MSRNYTNTKNTTQPEKSEGDSDNKKKSESNDITGTMVNTKDLKEIGADMAGFALGNAVRGKENSMTRLGRMLIADTVYEYALDAQFEKGMSKASGAGASAPSGQYTPQIAKLVGLTLTHATVNSLTGLSGFSYDNLWDSAISSGGIVLTTSLVQMYAPEIPAE